MEYDERNGYVIDLEALEKRVEELKKRIASGNMEIPSAFNHDDKSSGTLLKILFYTIQAHVPRSRTRYRCFSVLREVCKRNGVDMDEWL